jgi:MYXO-CTERM domain-containing protein
MDGSMSDLVFVPEPDGAAAGACVLAALARLRSRRRRANG